MKRQLIMFVAFASMMGSFLTSSYGRDVPNMNEKEFFSDKLYRSIANDAKRGRIEKLDKIFLSHPEIDVNHQGKDGVTVLLWPLIKKNKVGFEYLLEKGADPTIIYDNDTSVMYFSAIMEDSYFLKKCLAYGADPDVDKTIFSAIKNFRLGNIKAILEAGGDPNIRNNAGQSPILYSASWLHFDYVYTIVELGGDLLQENPDAINARTIVDYIYRRNLDPYKEGYYWMLKVIDLLEEKGVVLDKGKIHGYSEGRSFWGSRIEEEKKDRSEVLPNEEKPGFRG